MVADQQLETTIESLYKTFASYESGTDFCRFCYSEDEITRIIGTPLRQLDQESARMLLWEIGDHWQSSSVYRHYLPRILQVLAPPESCEDLFPAHLFETLRYMNFQAWPLNEQQRVREFLTAVTPLLSFVNDDERNEWLRGCETL